MAISAVDGDARGCPLLPAFFRCCCCCCVGGGCSIDLRGKAAWERGPAVEDGKAREQIFDLDPKRSIAVASAAIDRELLFGFLLLLIRAARRVTTTSNATRWWGVRRVRQWPEEPRKVWVLRPLRRVAVGPPPAPLDAAPRAAASDETDRRRCGCGCGRGGSAAALNGSGGRRVENSRGVSSRGVGCCLLVPPSAREGAGDARRGGLGRRPRQRPRTRRRRE